LKSNPWKDDTGIFTGYGSIFGNRDSYGEIVKQGAFKNSLSANPAQSIKLLWQHDPSMPIGVYEDIQEDEKGLLVRGRLLVNEVAKAKEAYALLKSGAITGLSIGYSIKPNGSLLGPDGVKYLTDLNLREISLVTFPANTLANVTSIKSIKQIKTVRDFEKYLRDSGLSKKEAIALSSIAAKGFHDRSDSDEAELVHALHALKHTIHTEVLPDERRNTSLLA
jgi:uncharacterized protein